MATDHEQIAERRWNERDVEHRAMRVLFEMLEPLLRRWPRRTRAWIDALPAVTAHSTAVTATPTTGVSWPLTRRAGWPPQDFVARHRRRTPATTLATTVRWCLDELAALAPHAAVAERPEQKEARARLAAAMALLDTTALAEVSGDPPGHAELRAIRAEGSPWRSLVPVCERLLWRHRTPLDQLAMELVAPDPALGGRLFHLAVLGEVLHALRSSGATVTNVVPLGAGAKGPHFLVEDYAHRPWRLWFESAGSWSSDPPEPYLTAAKALFPHPQPLGADLMLEGPDGRVLLFECKYSSNRSTVAAGYHQAVCYAVEAFARADHVTSVVVGPTSVIRSAEYTQVDTALIGFVSPDDVPSVVEAALRQDAFDEA
ncbi:MAG TPA: hypothetical protein VFG42_09990 [Baekduia sp.]|nr:hypothetical protein [Baekduia sp.]